MFTNRLPTAVGGLVVLLLLGCRGADDADRRPRDAERASASNRPTDSLPPGGELARELGCGACHAGLPAADLVRERAPSFGDGGRSYEPAFLLSYLQSPGRVRTDIGRSRMPDFHLSEAESVALSLFILERSGRTGSAGAEFRAARREHPGAGAERGRRIYRALNCAGCHRGSDSEPWSAGPSLAPGTLRARPAWLRGWLVDPTAIRPFGFHPGTGSRMPDFRLAEGEADTLTEYLLSREGAAPDSVSPAGLPTLSTFERRKAATLLRDGHSCLGCHRLAGEGGRIGPALDGVADRRPSRYLLRILSHPDSAAPGTVMPRIPMTDERRRLLAGYLAGLEAATAGGESPRSGYLSLADHPVRPPTSAERGSGRRRATGGQLYRARCASCHGVDGTGDGYNARYLPTPPAAHASAEAMSRRTDGILFDGLWAGGRTLDGSHRMPPFGESLSREQAWSLVDHIRELCDCRGPAWSRGERGGVR